ncbi:MAG: UDP-N-acetylmuramate--L-alanine ligase [Candidatus Bipolaricaulota bacterium]|nr:UDP-N-acetylmuramate--L-alanine ligase [Candidatus Bipolaricaulota bacterium]MDW8030376.1 UDP-N-acetylmuramate--L-alanine ligase [Candidatus Bipolaricaulota bacterium]
MSGLAKVYSELGWRVTGCNIEENRRTKQLRALGIPITIGHERAHLQNTTHLVVSSAIPPENIELLEAHRLGLPILHRFDLLNELVRSRYTIAVTGTHGKTTTAAMIATLLERAWLDPTFVIGAASPTLGTHARLGLGRHLVAEVCESDGRFVQLRPNIAVITNIGRDHLNFYGSETALQETFTRFAHRSELCITCADDPGAQRAIVDCIPTALTYSIERPADLVAYDLVFSQFHTMCEISWRGRHAGRLELLHAPGIHNVYNALAALLVGYSLGLPFADMTAYLRDFQLPERRFQVLITNGITIVDDYAHLPEQIQRNLQAIRRSWHSTRIVALFQPHRFTRTCYLGREFSTAFDLADTVILTDIYPAFERPIPGVGIDLILEDLRRRHRDVTYVPRGEDFVLRVRQLLRPGDFVIGFGAGDLGQELFRLAQAWNEQKGGDHGGEAR